MHLTLSASLDPLHFKMSIYTILSIIVGLLLVVIFTSIFLFKIISKNKIEKKDLKSWIKAIFDAFWGIG